MRILIIESRPGAGCAIARALATHPGFVMQIVSSAHDQLPRIPAQGFHAVVIEAITESARLITTLLREGQYLLPILVVSPATDPSSVAGLIEAGADDCLTRPLQGEELLSRVIALIRRSRGYATSCIELGGLTLDLNQGRVFREGSAFDLSPEEYRLLECLVLRHGQAVSAKEIAVEIFGTDHTPDSATVDQMVANVSRIVANNSGSIIQATSTRQYRICS